EINHGFGIVGEMRLAASDQRLLEPGADGFTAEEPQLAVLGRKNAFGFRRTQPLEILVQAVFELVALLRPILLLVARAGDVDVERWHRAVLHIKPVVVAPIAFLDRGFAAKNAAVFLRCRAATEMDEVSFA